MQNMKLSYFTNDDSFPLFIQFGRHDIPLFVHGHDDFYELVTVLDGSAEHVVDGESSIIRKGDVFVIGNGISHGFEAPDGLRICNIMYRPEMLFPGDSDIRQLPGFHALFLLEPYLSSTQHFQSRLRLTPSDMARVMPLINAAEAEYTTNSPGRKTMVLSLVRQLAVLLSRLYDCPTKPREISGIADAAAFMETSFADSIAISDVIEKSHYSQRHFIRLFSAAYGMTPQRYLLDVRIRHASAMLKESVLPVTEVALRCGFDDSNYFSRVFRKYTGRSPSEYRTKN